MHIGIIYAGNTKSTVQFRHLLKNNSRNTLMIIFNTTYTISHSFQ